MARSFNHNVKAEYKRKDDFEEKWQDVVSNDARCGYYAMFKENLVQEQYLKLLDVGNAITLAQLRTNNCKQFPTNKYRFNTYEWDVLCPLCNTQECGDELHYIFRCPRFEKIRPNFFRC